MKKITFNKQHALCGYCHKNTIPIGKWNRPCKSCKKKKDTQSEQEGVYLKNKEPSAIIKDEKGREIYVDKYGDVVENPGYDLKEDPRGWKYTGKRTRNKEII